MNEKDLICLKITSAMQGTLGNMCVNVNNGTITGEDYFGKVTYKFTINNGYATVLSPKGNLIKKINLSDVSLGGWSVL
jgi:hypothetical protein